MICEKCGGTKAKSERHQCAPGTRAARGSHGHAATRILALDVGDVLAGGWKVESRIGQGAMGKVYRARNLQTGKIAALKILLPESCRTPELVARFEREAQLLATLRHPNIVELYDVGRRGALPYIVMQFVSGARLDKYAERRGGFIDGPELLNLAGQICDGLSVIHREGLVHRDIKPSNIIVDDHGHVTILDLGVARDLREPLFTEPGLTIGTPYYMAPEQIIGPMVDHRADVYALGALVFELVTGTLPFDGADEHEVMHHHCATPAPNATERDPVVPAALSRMLLKAMSKNPADRFQTVEEFRQLLFDAYSGERTQYAHQYEPYQSSPQMTLSGQETNVGPVPQRDTIRERVKRTKARMSNATTRRKK